MKRERILPVALILLAWFSIPHASADGGFFPTSREIAVSTGQRAIITKNGNDLSITLSTGYTGEGGDFCWIIPTPVTPAIDKVVEAGTVGEDAFKILDEVTAPVIYTRKSGGCFPSGTEVLTTSGPCAIEMVGPGTTVFACDLATGVWVEAAVLRTLSQQYDGDMISIQMGAITLRATGNHPFYVLEGDRVASRLGPKTYRKKHQIR